MRFEYILSMLPHVTAHVTANLLYITIHFYMLPHVTVFYKNIYYIYVYIFIKKAVTCSNM